jgi:hypothetical protein
LGDYLFRKLERRFQSETEEGFVLMARCTNSRSARRSAIDFYITRIFAIGIGACRRYIGAGTACAATLFASGMALLIFP